MNHLCFYEHLGVYLSKIELYLKFSLFSSLLIMILIHYMQYHLIISLQFFVKRKHLNCLNFE